MSGSRKLLAGDVVQSLNHGLGLITEDQKRANYVNVWFYKPQFVLGKGHHSFNCPVCTLKTITPMLYDGVGEEES